MGLQFENLSMLLERRDLLWRACQGDKRLACRIVWYTSNVNRKADLSHIPDVVEEQVAGFYSQHMGHFDCIAFPHTLLKLLDECRSCHDWVFDSACQNQSEQKLSI